MERTYVTLLKGDLMSRLLRAVPYQVSGTSKDGDGIKSQDNQFQDLRTLMVKIVFPTSSCHFPCSSSCPLPPILSLHTSGKSLSLSTHVVADRNKDSHKPSLVKAKQTLFPQFVLTHHVFQLPDHLGHPPFESL